MSLHADKSRVALAPADLRAPTHYAPSQSAVEADLDLLLDRMLVEGGDERIRPDPVTGRNRYGTTAAPAPHEIWLSSSTASCISPDGYQAARAALGLQLELTARAEEAEEAWFDGIRAGIGALYGHGDSEIVLTASGTDGEIVAVAIAGCILPGPITNIVVAPGETGSGVLHAAGGRHFLATTSLGHDTTAGRSVAGLDERAIETQAVEIRRRDGRPRPAVDIDDDAMQRAKSALQSGRSVVLHVLETSKTGLAGVSVEAASAIRQLAPERVLVLVDACQLRCPPEDVHAALAAGFMVLTTGSKLAGGPPFSGALLLPAAIASRLARGQGASTMAAGLASMSARLDWPERLRPLLAGSYQNANAGLGLRWTAALSELDALAAIAPFEQAVIVDFFAAEVERRIRTTTLATGLPDAFDTPSRRRSIVPLLPRHGDGRYFGVAETARLHVALRKTHIGGVAAPVVHVGQPVVIGTASALRVCAGARHIVEAAEALRAGHGIADAFARIDAELDALIAKWSRIVEA